MSTYGTIPAGPNGQEYEIFSTKGHQDGEAFYVANEMFKQTGKQPPGFVIMPKGSKMGENRTFFEESISPLLQRTAEKVFVPETLNKVMPQDVPRLKQQARESVDTPPEALATVAGLVGGPLTKGLSPIIGALTRAGLMGAGYAVGQAVGGEYTGKHPVDALTEPLMVSAVTLAGEGVVGGFNRLVLGPMKERAVRQVSEGIMTLLSREYPQMENMGLRAVDHLAGDPKAVQKIAQIGVQGLKYNNDVVAEELLAKLPDNLSLGQKAKFTELFSDVTKAANTFLDNQFQGKETVALGQEVNTALNSLKGHLMGLAKRNNADVGLVTQLMKEIESYEQGMLNGGYTISLLKQAGQERGFNLAALQKAMGDKAHRLGSQNPYLAELGNIIGMGETGAFQQPKTFKMNMGIPGTSRIPGMPKIPIEIERQPGFAGQVDSKGLPSLPVDLIAIQEYLRRK